MAKGRQPIATRTRNRIKSQEDNSNAHVAHPPSPAEAKNTKTQQSIVKKFNGKVAKTQPKKIGKRKKTVKDNKDIQYNLPYLPKSNLDIHLQELHQLPSSFIRGSTAERRRDILRNDQDAYYDTSHFTLDTDGNNTIAKELSFLINDDMTQVLKTTEYSTCLHRAFIKKRFLSDQECLHLAKYVNCDFYTQSLQELAMLIKDELHMYRIDFTERQLHHIRAMNITEQAFLENEKGLEKVLEQQLNEDYLRYFWGGWITKPFVDPVSFFSISGNKDLLAKITAKTMIEHLKYFFNIISTKKLDEQLKKMDKISIAIILPG